MGGGGKKKTEIPKPYRLPNLAVNDNFFFCFNGQNPMTQLWVPTNGEFS